MNFRQDFNALPQQDLNKILTQFKYQFVGTSPSVETQNVDVLPNDELQITESEMILKKYSSFILPSGPTSERPASTIQGAIRLNTDTGSFESFNGSSWADVGGGGGLEFSEDNYQIEGENLCSNGTFDEDVSGWTADVEWDSTNGGRALVNNCDDGDGCEASYEFEVPETGYYMVQFDADPSTIASVYFGSGSGYIEASGKITLVDYIEAGTEELIIANYYQDSGQKMWIDNVQIFKVASNIPNPNIEFSDDFHLFLNESTTYLGNSPNPGGSNIGFGYNSLFSNTTGYYNTALGNNSLYSNTTGDQNTAVGNYSLYANTTGYSNTALGYNSLYRNISGGANTAVGYYSLQANTTGSYNTALGNYSLYSNTTGGNNTALGYNSLYSNTTGSTNTAIGYQAYQSGTYSNSTAIGYQAQPTKSNQAVIGNNSLEELKVRNYVFNVDQTLGAGQDGWVLKYNHSTGQAEFAAP